jgi:hypothetical protein
VAEEIVGITDSVCVAVLDENRAILPGTALVADRGAAGRQ